MQSQARPGASVAIDREQRDAISADVMNHLSGVGDIYEKLDVGDAPHTQRLRRDLKDDLRLLDDLGWAEQEPAESFDLTHPPVELERTVRRLRDDATHGLQIATVNQKGEQEAAQRYAVAFSAYDFVLAQLEGDQRGRR